MGSRLPVFPPFYDAAFWMAMVSCFIKNMARVPLACKEWDPTLSMTKPKQSLELTIWHLLPFRQCQYFVPVATEVKWHPGKVQIRVSRVAPSWIMSQACVTTAWMGQQGLPLVRAWCDRVSPLFSFFWLLIVRETRLI